MTRTGRNRHVGRAMDPIGFVGRRASDPIRSSSWQSRFGRNKWLVCSREPHRCPACGAEFRMSDDLEVHLLTAHYEGNVANATHALGTSTAPVAGTYAHSSMIANNAGSDYHYRNYAGNHFGYNSTVIADDTCPQSDWKGTMPNQPATVSHSYHDDKMPSTPPPDYHGSIIAGTALTAGVHSARGGGIDTQHFMQDSPETVKQLIPRYGAFQFPIEQVDRELCFKSERLGPFHGIQGENNSCYLDAAVMAMFYTNDTFDDSILRSPTQLDGPKKVPESKASNATIFDDPVKKNELGYAQTFFTLHIVNNLRRRAFVPSMLVLEWRRMIDAYFGGKVDFDNYCEQQESCEFVRFLLENFGGDSVHFCVQRRQPNDSMKRTSIAASTNISDSNEIEVTKVDEDEKIDQMKEVMLQLLPPSSGTAKDVTSTEQLLSLFLDSEELRLSQVGRSLILQLPRYGSKDRLIGAMVPSPFLHVTSHGKEQSRKCRLELRAVIVIGTGHFVTYLRIPPNSYTNYNRKGASSVRWLYFDSMSDRLGGQNVPLIEDVTEELSVLELPNASKTIEKELARNCSNKKVASASHLRRVTQDMSMVFYTTVHSQPFTDFYGYEGLCGDCNPCE